MPHPRKLFLRTVIGLLVFGVVTIGLRAASHEITRAVSRTVATLDLNGYRMEIAETPQNPNDQMDNLGIHKDGYIYTCRLYRHGVEVSSCTVKRQKGFHAEQVSVQPALLLKNARMMIEVELRPTNGAAVDVDCIVTPPATDDAFSNGVIDWRTVSISGS